VAKTKKKKKMLLLKSYHTQWNAVLVKIPFFNVGQNFHHNSTGGFGTSIVDVLEHNGCIKNKITSKLGTP
jgi:hypothetical protein